MLVFNPDEACSGPIVDPVVVAAEFLGPTGLTGWRYTILAQNFDIRLPDFGFVFLPGCCGGSCGSSSFGGIPRYRGCSQLS